MTTYRHKMADVWQLHPFVQYSVLSSLCFWYIWNHIEQIHMHSLMQSHAILLSVFYVHWRGAGQDATERKKQTCNASHAEKRQWSWSWGECLRLTDGSTKSAARRGRPRLVQKTNVELNKKRKEKRSVFKKTNSIWEVNLPRPGTEDGGNKSGIFSALWPTWIFKYTVLICHVGLLPESETMLPSGNE